MDLTNIIDRKSTIRTLPEPPTHVKQRIAQAADELNRAGTMAAQVEVINEAICKFTHILYQRDTDGHYPNFDKVTQRIIIPAPWGSSGWRRWGLRHWEAGTLRKILLGRQARFTVKQRPPLFGYSDRRYWYLNIIDYPNYESAQNWLMRGAITLQEWRQTL